MFHFSNSSLEHCLLPQWPAPARVRALFTTRNGGASQVPYASWNLGSHVGDDAGKVLHNRQRLQKILGARPIFLQQVHGTQIVELDASTPDDLPADACTTTLPRVVCTVMVADCLPILLCDSAGHRVAAIHAGWRGLLGFAGQGVVEHACRYFDSAALDTEDRLVPGVLAWLGPCIGPRAFEVRAEVYAAFVAADARAQGCFVARTNTSTYLADLAGLARLRLQALGVDQIYGNDGSDAWCTVSNPDFFSYRRDGVTGRQAVNIWLEPI